MPIYTRTGDKGQTSLLNGQRVSKGHLRVDVYGTVDELNSIVGIAVAEAKNAKVKKELIKIQNDLFEIGSTLASGEKGTLSYLEKRIKEFEKLIDEMTKKLPPLSNFILPGGGRSGASLHLARTVTRRAERKIVALSEKEHSTHSTSSGQASAGQENIDKNIMMYLNRLSDLLFTMARFVNFGEKKKEIIWKQGGH